MHLFQLAIAASLFAQPVGGSVVQSLSQDGAVAAALASNPRLQAAVYEIQAARRGAGSAAALANPQITLTPGLTRAGSDEELTIAQPLELNGARAARTAQARARLRQAEALAVGELRRLVYEVRTAHVELARAEARLALSESLAKHAEEIDRIALRAAEMGSRPGIERTQTTIELGRAKAQVRLAQAERASAAATLNALLAREPTAPVSAGDLPAASATASDAQALVREALERRTEVALSLAVQDAARQEARLARAEGVPDLTPHYRAESWTRSPRSGGFGVSISIPLIDFGSRKNKIAQAELSAKAEAARREAVKAGIAAEVTQALARLSASREVLAGFEGGILEQARKLLEATRAGFGLGETSFVQMLEAQRTYRALQAEYLEALASHAEAVAELEYVTGAVSENLLGQVPVGGEKK